MGTFGRVEFIRVVLLAAAFAQGASALAYNDPAKPVTVPAAGSEIPSCAADERSVTDTVSAAPRQQTIVR